MYSYFYFLLTIFIGSFFLINLTMAIIAVKYSEAISSHQDKPVVVVEKDSFNMKNLI